LAERWTALLSAHARDVGVALLDRHREPHRRYHTVEHLAEVLAVLDDLAEVADDPRAAELAVWFHDAVYDPRAESGANERASAALAVETLGDLAIERSTVDEVRRLVLLTASHDPAADDGNGVAVCDADLAILGAPQRRYERYVADVRAEYAWVDDESWRRGRSALVRGFLERPRLYVSDRAHGRYDRPARRNLAWELAALGP
jgi:predicted metal-dependent HD superfamily phosphohydrolase